MIKKCKTFHRVGAFFTTVALLFSMTPASSVYAAVENNPSISVDGASSTAVLVGESVDVQASSNAEYTLASPPFTLKNSAGEEISLADYFTVAGNGDAYTLTAKPSAAGEGTAQYTLSGNFEASGALTVDAKESWPAYTVKMCEALGGAPARPEGVSDDLQLEASSRADTVAEFAAGTRLKGGSLTLTALNTQAAGESLKFGVTNATGMFSALSGGEGNGAEITASGANGTWNLVLPIDGGIPLTLTSEQSHPALAGWTSTTLDSGDPVHTPQLGTQRKQIIKGTTFTLNVQSKVSKPVTIKVASPQYLANQVAAQINGDPVENGYIRLSGSDKLGWITKNFQLASVKTNEYGQDCTIDWTLSGTSDALSISNGAQYATAKVTQQEQNAPLTLSAAVSCGSASASASVNIGVRGLGKPAWVELGEKSVGAYNGNDTVTALNDPAQNLAGVPTKMDTYKNSFEDYTGTNLPYQFTATLHMGAGAGRSSMAFITSDNPGAVEVQVRGAAYGFGTMISGSDTDDLQIPVTVRAKTADQSTRLTFTFKGPNADGEFVTYETFSTPTISVVDSSPSPDATLAALTASSTSDGRFTSSKIELGFDPEKTAQEFSVPYAAKEIELTAKANHMGAKVSFGNTLASGASSTAKTTVSIPDSGSQEVQVYVQSQNPQFSQTYTYRFKRVAPSTDNSVKSMSLTTSKQEGAENLLTPQVEANRTSYTATIPYGTTKLYFTAASNDVWAEDIQISLNGGSNSTQSNMLRSAANSVVHSKSGTASLTIPLIDSSGAYFYVDGAPVVLNLSVTSQSGETKDYVVNIIPGSPSEDNRLNQLGVKITGARDPINFTDFGAPVDSTTTVAFSPDVQDYYITIPYHVKELTFTATPSLSGAQAVRMVKPGGSVEKKEVPAGAAGTNKQVTFNSVKVGKSSISKDYFTFSFFATAESGKPTTLKEAKETKNSNTGDGNGTTQDQKYAWYTVNVTRIPAESDNTLSGITFEYLTDAGEYADATNGEFDPYFASAQTSYTVEIDNDIDNLRITPLASLASSTVAVTTPSGTYTLNDKVLNVSMNNLVAGKSYTVTVKVTSEDGKAKTYTFKLKRKSASSKAQLKTLVIGANLPFQPETTLFVPSKTSYRVEIPNGTISVPVKGTLADPKALVKVNGKIVEVDPTPPTQTEPTEPKGEFTVDVDVADKSGKITIEITAPNGTTKKTYTVNYKNWTYVVPSDNADLASLSINYGDLEPAFKPNIVEYEVYVKPDAMSIDLTPRKADSDAEMTVFENARKISSNEGVYSGSLLEDETTFTIEVAPEDPNAETKVYTLTVYKNDEEKMGVLNPITNDMVPFEDDPIVIDISKYTIVDAEVFNTLKTDYPEKTVLFKGNDYTLEMKGKDIKTLVPHTATFDLRLSFRSPDQEEIEELLDEEYDESRLEPIYIYFAHSGTLPAEMKLTVSLGKEYRNQRLYWNYYNKDRDRIDYYGYVTTNAKGTFTVPITHFSTYIITIIKIVYAENKAGMDFGGVAAAENLTSAVNGAKPNPNTGVHEKERGIV